MSKHDLKGRTVLVTGAAGCIGATVVKQLIDMDATPIVYDLSCNRSRLHLIMEDADKVPWENGDITNLAHLDEIVKKNNVCAIIHLAAAQIPFCKADPVETAKVNVVGTTVILELARQNNIKRVVFASSVGATAMGDNKWLDTIYGAHKMCGELLAKVYWQDWQCPSVCIRPAVIYGPGRDQGMTSCPTLAMLAAMTGTKYSVPFTGPVSFVHVEDAAARFIGAVSQDQSGAFVFEMNGTTETVENVVNMINSQIEGAEITAHGNSLPFPSDEDDGSLDKHIGAAPYRTMKDGLAQTLDSFKHAQSRGVLTKELVSSILEKNS